MSILRSSFHQDEERFNICSHGEECTGIAAVACVAILLLDRYTSTVSDIDYIVIVRK